MKDVLHSNRCLLSYEQPFSFMNTASLTCIEPLAFCPLRSHITPPQMYIFAKLGGPASAPSPLCVYACSYHTHGPGPQQASNEGNTIKVPQKFYFTLCSHQAVALSLVPTNHCISPDTMSLASLTSLVTWVQGRMAIDPTPNSTSSQAPRTCLALLRAMETFVCRDLTELVLVFVLICRSLGFSARFLLAAT